MRRMDSRIAVAGVVWAALVAACDDGDPNALRRGDVDPSDNPTAEATSKVSEGGLRVLTQYEYAQTIHDLFGTDIVVPKISQDTSVNGWTTVGASTASIAPTASDDFETAALDIAKQVFDPARRDKVSKCAPIADAGDACTRAFIETWGKRAFRRGLTKEEVDEYVGLAIATSQDLGGPWAGLESALGAMLESPNFVYRLDAIEDDPTKPGEARFTSYAMASRLSFLLWGSTPDDQLLDSAGKGELGSTEGIKAAADRLLASDKAQNGVLRFFDEWLAVSSIDTVEKDAKLFPELTPQLRTAMREQISRTLKDLLWDRGQSYLDLFQTKDIFMSPELAPIYGVATPPSSGFTKITLDGSQPRAGIFGWAGILTLKSRAYASSPTLRGLFVRERVLCQTVPPPPPDATQQQPQEANGVPLTTRERAQARLSNPNCSSCHARMDGIGLGLENFDAIGRYRTSEGSTTIDTSGQLDGHPFKGATDLAKAVHDHPDTNACGARNLFRYATGRMETGDDEQQVQELAAKFTNVDHRMKAMFSEIVASSAFRLPKSVARGGK